MLIFYAILVGAIAGVLPGLFGIGGGVILVPLINLVLIHLGFPLDSIMQYAIGTSLATMVFSTASASYFHIKRGAVLWVYYKCIAPCMILGGIIGVSLADSVSNNILKVVFSNFCMLMAVNFSLDRSSQTATSSRLPKAHLGLGFLGLGVGICAGLLGIGGGLLLLPVLTRLGWPLKQVVSLAALCSLPTVFFAAIGAMCFGLDAPYQPTIPHIGYVLWPLALIQGMTSLATAYLGVSLTHFLPDKWLKRILAGLLLLLSGLMFPWK